MKGILFLCLFIGIELSAAGQQSGNTQAQRSFNNAQAFLDKGAYEDAAVQLQQAIDKDPDFQLAYLQLGDVYRRLKTFDKSTVIYLKALELNAPVDSRVYYSLGESQLLTGDYTNAQKHLNLFISTYEGKDQKILVRAKKYLNDCSFAIEALKTPQPFQPQNMGGNINSKYREYFPAITADGRTMIYSRVIDGNEDFLISTRSKSTDWTEAVPLSTNINTKEYNEGAQSLSPDGKYLFFTGCNRPDGFGSCDIYVSHKSGKKWDRPFNLGSVVNSKYWDSQPAVSPDGNTLYFSSNRPGGLGGYDLWKTQLKKDGTWSAPVNLGPEINTPYDEHTPFVHPDGQTLYFSSDGWPGMGNKDIFYSRTDVSGNWSRPVNLGYPINSYHEETGLIVTPDGLNGIFSTTLTDTFGELDLYSFKMPVVAKPKQISYVNGTVYDKESKQPLAAEVLVVDLKTKKTQFNDFTSAETGDFLAVMPVGSNYSLNVSAKGYLFYSDHFELQEKNGNKPVELIVYMERIKTGSNLTLKNIFFDTNMSTLLPPSLTELEILLGLLRENPKMTIEIQGHTDNTGNDVQNMALSNARAKAVYNYLLEQNVEAERLKYKGYGKDKPLANNASPEGRQKNRRTSFVVTGI
ncbi:OmpA family protein [Pedobacter sp. SAFR-022]|uniref:OmpA family protein n=1 Tax=Pedobacter sp. SAFR-022 TaxID=3436861 RepID=UPI003F7D47C4